MSAPSPERGEAILDRIERCIDVAAKYEGVEMPLTKTVRLAREELASLRADNERLRAALERIAYPGCGCTPHECQCNSTDGRLIFADYAQERSRAALAPAEKERT